MKTFLYAAALSCIAIAAQASTHQTLATGCYQEISTQKRLVFTLLPIVSEKALNDVSFAYLLADPKVQSAKADWSNVTTSDVLIATKTTRGVILSKPNAEQVAALTRQFASTTPARQITLPGVDLAVDARIVPMSGVQVYYHEGQENRACR